MTKLNLKNFSLGTVKLDDNNVRKVAIYNAKISKGTEEVSIKGDLHHIHIIDRSYSMSNDIKELIENLKKAIEASKDNTKYISVVWFSSEGQCSTLLKGANPSDTESINKLLDSIASTIGCTCFSEPLYEANTIMEDLKALCPNFIVTLFTDGYPVVNDYSKEMNDIDDALDKIKKSAISLNTIGYGYSYNRELLLKMTSITPYGKFFHSSDIKDYNAVISNNILIAESLTLESVKVKTKLPFMFNTLSTVKLYDVVEETEESFSLTNYRNQLVFFLDEDITNNIVTIDDEEVNLNNIKGKALESTLTNIRYSLAYELFLNNNRTAAMAIYKSLEDGVAYTKCVNSFTLEEHFEVSKYLLSIALKKGKRADSVDAFLSDQTSLITVLNKLEQLGVFAYKPVDGYNKISKTVSEGYVNLFKKDVDQKPTRLKLSANSSRVNLSYAVVTSGSVDINPVLAKQVSLPENNIKTATYRNYNIIHDANLNMKSLKIGANDLTEVEKMLKDSNVSYIPGLPDGDIKTLILDLTSVPIASSNINTNVFNDDEYKVTFFSNEVKEGKTHGGFDPDNVIEILEGINKAKCDIKYLSSLQSVDSPLYSPDLNTDLSVYTPEQRDLLKAHGIGNSGYYNTIQPVSEKVDETNYNDKFEIRTIKLSLDKFSTIPSINAMNKKINQTPYGYEVQDGKKLNESESLLFESMTYYQGSSPKEVLKELLEAKTRLSNLESSLLNLRTIMTISGHDIAKLEKKTVRGKEILKYKNLNVAKEINVEYI